MAKKFPVLKVPETSSEPVAYLIGVMRESAEKPSQPDAQPATSPAVSPAAAPPSSISDEDLTIDLSKYDGYDDETLRIVKVAKHLQEQNQLFHQALVQMQQDRIEELHSAELVQFHDVVDGMDKDLFGGEGALNDEIDSRRKKLWDSYLTIKDNAYRNAPQDGRPVKLPPIKVLLHRAALFAFGDEILTSERKRNPRAISEQSRRRRRHPARAR